MRCSLNHKIFSINNKEFEALTLEVFMFQYEHNSVYRQFVDALAVDVQAINSLPDIPFMPIGFFKSHRVATTVF